MDLITAQRNFQANAKAIDSLLNYETVKYFGNEAHEAARFDVGRRRYESAAIRSSRTLSMLNVGQGAIIAFGLALVMILAGYGVVGGTMTVARGTTYTWREAWTLFLSYYGSILRNVGSTIVAWLFLGTLIVGGITL